MPAINHSTLLHVALKFLACVAGTGLNLHTHAADAIPAPDEWRKETLTFPLEFAPALKYDGVEHVRFAPQWKDFADERGFSYMFVWDVKSAPLGVPELERDLIAYFDGLMQRAAESRKLTKRGNPTKAAFDGGAAVAGWTQAYAGVLRTWNAFADGAPLVLEMEITKRPCGNDRMQVFFMVSKAQRTDAIWDTMRAARGATVCAV